LIKNCGSKPIPPTCRIDEVRINIHAEIGEILAGITTGRSSAGEISLYKSVRIAIRDGATADLVHQKALRQEIGAHGEI
jgi:ornithine cyclodeaminase/alanine dehydrogenase-like protein (mu-crystallin family)